MTDISRIECWQTSLLSQSNTELGDKARHEKRSGKHSNTVCGGLMDCRNIKPDTLNLLQSAIKS